MKKRFERIYFISCFVSLAIFFHFFSSKKERRKMSAMYRTFTIRKVWPISARFYHLHRRASRRSLIPRRRRELVTRHHHRNFLSVILPDFDQRNHTMTCSQNYFWKYGDPLVTYLSSPREISQENEYYTKYSILSSIVCEINF